MALIEKKKKAKTKGRKLLDVISNRDIALSLSRVVDIVFRVLYINKKFVSSRWKEKLKRTKRRVIIVRIFIIVSCTLREERETHHQRGNGTMRKKSETYPGIKYRYMVGQYREVGWSPPFIATQKNKRRRPPTDL